MAKHLTFLVSFSVYFCSLVDAHSWAIDFNNGDTRGGSIGRDSELERLVCPLPTLRECQPDPKHGITLTADAMRPCRAGRQSKVIGTANAGGPLWVSWAGNGHANSQSDGTCVKVYYTKYKSDPSYSDFTLIPGATCLPYWRQDGGIRTDGTFNLPDNMEPGKYTFHWLWDFDPFWYGSCADMYIYDKRGNGGSTTTAAPTTTRVGSSTQSTSQSSNPATSSVEGSESEKYYIGGCAATTYPNRFCVDAFGLNSYCKTWQTDSCGRAVCQGDSYSSLSPTCSGSGSPTTTTTRNPATSTNSPTTSTASTTSTGSSYKQDGCGRLTSGFCTAHMGFASYCKKFSTDECGRSVCHGDSHSSLDPC